jgi:hypothetical protein
MKRKKLQTNRQNSAGKDLCWRLKQKYDRYLRTDAPIGACQEMGDPDLSCMIFGDPAYRVGWVGRNRACVACGRYWIS